jgi:hypothetical protein
MVIGVWPDSGRPPRVAQIFNLWMSIAAPR